MHINIYLEENYLVRMHYNYDKFKPNKILNDECYTYLSELTTNFSNQNIFMLKLSFYYLLDKLLKKRSCSII
jgi:hypothetical protein